MVHRENIKYRVNAEQIKNLNSSLNISRIYGIPNAPIREFCDVGGWMKGLMIFFRWFIYAERMIISILKWYMRMNVHMKSSKYLDSEKGDSL